MKKSPIGNYEYMAKKYADTVDTKPIHIYYERPNTWSLLPKKLKGLKVLDLGCGSGWYAEQLMKAGAKVTAIDASPTFVELTQARLGKKGKCIVADLEQPLDFLANKSFDLIIAPLVIHYIKDLQSLFLELSCLLKPNGIMVFSTHNPYTSYKNFNLKSYYKKTLIKDFWPRLKVEVKSYHHTLHDLIESLANAGFVIERMLEPMPSLKFKKTDPEMYKLISTQPWFLYVRVRKIKL